jgi:hypothetical protein
VNLIGCVGRFGKMGPDEARSSCVDRERLANVLCCDPTARGRPDLKRSEKRDVACVADSGASKHITGNINTNISPFKSLSERILALVVADCRLPVRARVGRFFPNILGLAQGVYHPDLGELFFLRVYELFRSGVSTHCVSENFVIYLYAR